MSLPKLSGEKILITGPAGQIAAPLAAELAKDNEVWGIARFSAEGSREEVEAMGVTTRVIDLADGDFSELPNDFSYLLHLAAAIGGSSDYDQAIRVNAEATGLLLEHCRSAKAAMVMSTFSVYKPNPDPHHRFLETDPLGEAVLPGTPTYSISKIAEEAVARFCARSFNLPVVIARMNSAYSSRGGLPAYHLDAIVAGQQVTIRHDPCPYSVIHQDDINAQTAALLGAASVPATIVNWCGDEAVSPSEWCAYFGELTGIKPNVVVQEVPGSQIGATGDVTKRASITGPCTVDWRTGFRRMYEERYPNGAAGGMLATGRANPLAGATGQKNS